MIDSHCHLADKQFNVDVHDVIQRAEEHGIEAMVCIADDLKEAEKCLQIAEKYEQVFCTIGVHPHHASQWDDQSEKQVRGLLDCSLKAVAVGEIGLDYHYMNSPKEVQKEVFARQLEIAKELELPAVVHCREAIDDLREIITSIQPQKLVVHCCTEKWEDVQSLVEAGYWLSFTGIATYPKSDDIRDTIKHCPLEQMMIETDAPYLAPIPHRGKRNEPAYVREVAKTVAEVKGLELIAVDEATTRNAVEFFGLVD